jgi:hypothetical protein
VDIVDIVVVDFNVVAVLDVVIAITIIEAIIPAIAKPIKRDKSTHGTEHVQQKRLYQYLNVYKLNQFQNQEKNNLGSRFFLVSSRIVGCLSLDAILFNDVFVC